MFQPYEPRAFRFIELLSFEDWRMKFYGIAWRREWPRPELLEAAKRVATDALRQAAPNNYKVGFVGAHDGRSACFAFVDFWSNENELHHYPYFASLGAPQDLRPAQHSDSSVCVWDLRLQSFEREAWIKHVLRRASAPDFDGYLGERLNEDA